jgi:hypothetical protein
LGTKAKEFVVFKLTMININENRKLKKIHAFNDVLVKCNDNLVIWSYLDISMQNKVMEPGAPVPTDPVRVTS